MIRMKSQLTYLKKSELYNDLSRQQDDFFALIDDQLKDHLPEWMKSSQNVYWLKRPEQNKNLHTFGEAVSFFLDQGISRTSVLYAIGGGATTDLAGFVAASLLRGISWVSVPTTLLAMVDGAIGGKVAVNMAQGKNLVGAFHAPQDVFICPDFLSTLPLEQWESGKGEILKYGFLSSKIFEKIVAKESIEVIAHECADFKKQVVENDFKEEGERILLNLGHTLGHGFESTLKIPHGLAVAMGIKYLLKIFRQQELLVHWEKMAVALGMDLTKLELSAYPDFDVAKFKKYLFQDKKRSQLNLRLVLIKKVGSCFVQEMNIQDFFKIIEAYEEFNR